MRKAIIELAQRCRREHGHHPGMILQRFLARQGGGTDERRNADERRDLLEAARRAAGNEALRSLYGLAFERWAMGLTGDVLRSTEDLRTSGRMIVGLGSENVLETGIRLHHTYGVPFIPGSALKGLASHYCDQVWGQRHLDDPPQESRRFRKHGEYHTALFGTADEHDAASGIVVFHDAWILPESLNGDGCLRLDVMTPHHPEWQTQKRAPTDFDSPTPIPFLSVTGTFRVVVTWAGPAGHPQAARWTDLALALLKQALDDFGIGGKTSSGYGRLVPLTSKTDDRQSAPTSAPVAKRPANTPCKVRILSARTKGGFDVQESGRRPGTLTVGSPPSGTVASVGDEVDVVVHDDDPRRPQYRWPAAEPKRKGPDRPSRPARDSRR